MRIPPSKKQWKSCPIGVWVLILATFLQEICTEPFSDRNNAKKKRSNKRVTTAWTSNFSTVRFEYIFFKTSFFLQNLRKKSLTSAYFARETRLSLALPSLWNFLPGDKPLACNFEKLAAVCNELIKSLYELNHMVWHEHFLLLNTFHLWVFEFTSNSPQIIASTSIWNCAWWMLQFNWNQANKRNFCQIEVRSPSRLNISNSFSSKVPFHLNSWVE